MEVVLGLSTLGGLYYAMTQSATGEAMMSPVMDEGEGGEEGGGGGEMERKQYPGPNPGTFHQSENFASFSGGGGQERWWEDGSEARETHRHQNMAPFVKHRLEGNYSDLRLGEHNLASRTGYSALDKRKETQAPLFAPSDTAQRNGVYGQQSVTDEQRARLETQASRMQNGVNPLGIVRVGPGVGIPRNQQAGNDGFNNGLMNLREYEKTVDELRVTPKLNATIDETRFAPGEAMYKEYAQPGEYRQNGRNRAFASGPDRWMRTTGAVIGPDADQGELTRKLRETDTAEYYGGAEGGQFHGASRSGVYDECKRNEYDEGGAALGIASGLAQRETMIQEGGDARAPTIRSYIEKDGGLFGAATNMLMNVLAPVTGEIRRTRKTDFVSTGFHSYGNPDGLRQLGAPIYEDRNVILDPTLKEMTHGSYLGNQNMLQTEDGYQIQPVDLRPSERTAYEGKNQFLPGASTLDVHLPNSRETIYTPSKNNIKSSTMDRVDEIRLTTGGMNLGRGETAQMSKRRAVDNRHDISAREFGHVAARPSVAQNPFGENTRGSAARISLTAQQVQHPSEAVVQLFTQHNPFLISSDKRTSAF